jgi:hypothetical protein
MVDSTETAMELRIAIDGHFEWLLERSEGPSFPLNRTEIEVEHKGGKILLGLPDDRGFRLWRINGFTSNDNDIKLDVAGSFGKEREQIRLVPRISAKALSLETEIARLKRANEIADALHAGLEKIKLVRVALAKDNGRIAHIFFKTSLGQLNALMTDVTETSTPESLLAAALIWQAKLDLRKKNRVDNLWIAAGTKAARNLQKLLALLKPAARNTITIAEVKESVGLTSIVPLPARAIGNLWRESAKKLVLPLNQRLSDTAQRIIEIAPDKIDVIYSRQGETLRLLGLPFARIRAMLGQEKAWFGVNRNRHPLTNDSWDSLTDLVAGLEDYRCFDTPNTHHELYRSVPEAWLESILRRNIKLLDANLILSPIYNQFRASNDKIDLLALRKDGRLVIIELKTSPDREMVFQAADYWRKIELQRRQGKLAEANLFDGREILDTPAIIYLAAPAWSFHRDYEFYARTLSKEIELWRFELHENWRENVKVIARKNYSDSGL